MANIVVVLPKIEDAKGIKNILVRQGFQVTAACTSGAQALSHIDNLTEGIVISGYRLADMLYTELHSCLPKGFEMLLLASQSVLTEECAGNNIMCLGMPIKVHDLLNTVDMMSTSMAYRRKKRRAQPKERNPEEKALINEAKRLLMSRNNMTEEEAHRYIQKCSMDNSTSMVETAQMVLAVMSN
ncbi:MAG: ANTAR domain-containing protein [Lachnospiraceae bacterium]|nr:ANTAR domain-containing protein [Lachnospiraceae bacterium]